MDSLSDKRLEELIEEKRSDVKFYNNKVEKIHEANAGRRKYFAEKARIAQSRYEYYFRIKQLRDDKKQKEINT